MLFFFPHSIAETYVNFFPLIRGEPTYSGNWMLSYIFFDNISQADDFSTADTAGLKPVINLKSTLKFTGDGTKNNPYVPSL